MYPLPVYTHVPYPSIDLYPSTKVQSDTSPHKKQTNKQNPYIFDWNL